MIVFAMRDEVMRCELEQLLCVRFVAHESEYFGDYWLAEPPGMSMRIRWNQDPLWRPGDCEDERFALPEFAEFPLLLEVDGPSAALLEKLRSISALQLLVERP
jgi:hypothetical protein